MRLQRWMGITDHELCVHAIKRSKPTGTARGFADLRAAAINYALCRVHNAVQVAFFSPQKKKKKNVFFLNYEIKKKNWREAAPFWFVY